MLKNVSGQQIPVYAWDNATGEAKTGDAANITAQISKDGGASAAMDATNPTELDAADHPGTYIFDALQAESNGDLIMVTPVSSTPDIVLLPVYIYTRTVMRGTDGANTTVPDAAGTGAAIAALIADLQTDLDTLTDARGEPGQGALPVSASTNLKVDYVYKILRNLKKTTATLIQIYNNAGDTVDHKMTIADDGTTYTENEIGSGP